METCRDEFHRRLKMYHDWKEANQNSHILPTSVHETHTFLQYAEMSNTNKPIFTANLVIQRFFRVPYEKPVGSQDYSKILCTGFWYAHFDGQYIVRQMEIQPNINKGILLQTGEIKLLILNFFFIFLAKKASQNWLKLFLSNFFILKFLKEFFCFCIKNGF